jgi:hypothetical protein
MTSRISEVARDKQAVLPLCWSISGLFCAYLKCILIKHKQIDNQTKNFVEAV